MLAHLTTRNLAAFSIDIDPFDYRTKDPSRVVRDVVRRVLSNKKGIILLHDVEPSTARGLKIMLDELHARGIRIVHLVPRGTAQTIPVYDAFVAKPLNDAERDLLTKRWTYWPLTKAGDLAVGVPVSAKGSQTKVLNPSLARPTTTSHSSTLRPAADARQTRPRKPEAIPPRARPPRHINRESAQYGS